MRTSEKKLVLCPHQVHYIRNAWNTGQFPESLAVLARQDEAVAEWLHGVCSAMCLAMNCLFGQRGTEKGRAMASIASRIADKVLEHRGPEITEHDHFTEGIDTVDEVPCDED